MNLKASADNVLARNRSRNRSATDTKKAVQPIDPLISSVLAVSKGLNIGCTVLCGKAVENLADFPTPLQALRDRLVSLEALASVGIPLDLETGFNRAISKRDRVAAERWADRIKKQLGTPIDPTQATEPHAEVAP